MNNRELKKRLTEYLDPSNAPEMDAGEMERTVDLCVAVMRTRTVASKEPRQSFWGFLSDVFHFEGIPLLLPQVAVLIAACLAAFSSRMGPYEIPSYMPLFILVITPVFFRGQRYRVSEVEAATRTSGAQLALARLILACGGALVCLTFLLGLRIYLLRSFEYLGRMVIYSLVPYLTCMTTMLILIRRSRRDGAPLCMAVALGSTVFWRHSSHIFPWLYEASALGIWIVAVLFYSWLLAKEIVFILRARREINMYGIVG